MHVPPLLLRTPTTTAHSRKPHCTACIRRAIAKVRSQSLRTIVVIVHVIACLFVPVCPQIVDKIRVARVDARIDDAQHDGGVTRLNVPCVVRIVRAKAHAQACLSQAPLHAQRRVVGPALQGPLRPGGTGVPCTCRTATMLRLAALKLQA